MKLRFRTGRLPMSDQLFESPVRHYVWGVVLVLIGLFTMFGVWFILAG